MSTSFYLCQAFILIFGLIFAIRICSFKKDAWYFYLLATIIGSFQFIDFSQFSLSKYFDNLAMYSHDLILPLVAILVYNRFGIQPKKITKDNLLTVSIFTLVVTILIILFNYLTLPISPFVDVRLLISVIFGIVVYLGSSLLIFGYIFGLLINSLYSLQYIVMSIIVIFQYDTCSLYRLTSILFSFLSFIIFLVGYTKNRKLISN
ncbi:hypothetical protein [Francisella hispaniensis]|uniref:Uncharacterized protein n=1 Tax=Francisella hispaniensis FSC454 TaxID=1088883 RepID=A0AAC9JAC1_9GAMM|nr:hypothetical protein [Francisella hispaniensis]APD50417.1 hypothetical protein FSC454_04380 [Francisella hispaniensis FSC454]KYW85201.1 hypothetical protein AUF42_04940 [Francisella hispaniensis FSC454]